jgi:hypothetical protein
MNTIVNVKKISSFVIFDDIEIGGLFQYDNKIWMRVPSVHSDPEEAKLGMFTGYDCVAVGSGEVMWLEPSFQVFPVTKLDCEIIE